LRIRAKCESATWLEVVNFAYDVHAGAYAPRPRAPTRFGQQAGRKGPQSGKASLERGETRPNPGSSVLQQAACRYRSTRKFPYVNIKYASMLSHSVTLDLLVPLEIACTFVAPDEEKGTVKPNFWLDASTSRLVSWLLVCAIWDTSTEVCLVHVRVVVYRPEV